MTSYGTVKYSTLIAVLDEAKKQMGTEDFDVSFEFLVGSFFPEIMDNIKDKMTESYIAGYKAGNDSKEHNV